MRPFLRAKITKSYVYLSVILWYPTLQVSFVLFTLLYSSFFVGYSIPKHSQCIKPLHYLCWPCFWQVFYWLAANYILTYFPEIQIHEVLRRISYFGLLCMSRTVSYRHLYETVPWTVFYPDSLKCYTGVPGKTYPLQKLFWLRQYATVIDLFMHTFEYHQFHHKLINV